MYYVENETEEKVDLKEVRAILKKIVSYYGEKRDFSVTFVTDSEIQELNKEYREIDAPTDILTFRLDDTPSFPISFEDEDVDFLNNEEMGDIFFAVVNLARWHKLDAEQCLITANRKFMKRFRKMEELATKPLTEYSFEEFDKLWKSAKNSSQEL